MWRKVTVYRGGFKFKHVNHRGVYLGTVNIEKVVCESCGLQLKPGDEAWRRYSTNRNARAMPEFRCESCYQIMFH